MLRGRIVEINDKSMTAPNDQDPPWILPRGTVNCNQKWPTLKSLISDTISDQVL